MSTLAVVEEILRETQEPMSVRQIVEHADGRLPTRSITPDTVVARDLSLDIKRKGERSPFIRTAPGRFTMREIHLRKLAQARAEQSRCDDGQSPIREPVLDTSPTPLASAAIRRQRAGTLPARIAADLDGDYASHNNSR